MSHTHVNLLIHIVFSTQGRLPLISREIRSELFAYIGGLVKELKGKPIIINGTHDHIHALISLPANVSLSDAMRFIKSNSSRWLSARFKIKLRGKKALERSAYRVRKWMRSFSTSATRKYTTGNSISIRNIKLSWTATA